jgi:NAD(P)-dependent dehydrogenase (short-subunit alcohol dehydrogenase family)
MDSAAGGNDAGWRRHTGRQITAIICHEAKHAGGWKGVRRLRRRFKYAACHFPDPVCGQQVVGSIPADGPDFQGLPSFRSAGPVLLQRTFMQIKDSVFIITGGASGLGAGTGRMLVEQGGKVVLADLNEAAGNALAAELGANARFVTTNVADEASARACVDAAVAAFGGLHGLINCAGIAPAEKVLGRNGPHSLDVFAKTVTVNLVGSFNMIRLASEAMSRGEPNAAGERGVIVSTASVAAYDGQIGQAAYAASKGGVVGMTLPVARELARYGIRVMTIAPGIFETPMLLGMPQEVQDALGKMVPFPSRLGKPAEYAALVRHIIENEMLNGEVIRLDGAIRMAPK